MFSKRFNQLDGGIRSFEYGLCNPNNEHNSCGVGFVADIKNRKSHKIVQDGLTILANLIHCGAVGGDPSGAGSVSQVGYQCGGPAPEFEFKFCPTGYSGVGFHRSTDKGKE